jgi:uncharacterized membrane protein
MIQQPWAIIALLVVVEAAVLFVSSRKRFERYFSFLPAVFWIYFIPMLLSTTGILTSKSHVYSIISEYVLPASLVLLLLTSDIKAILRLGPKALATMLIGSAGIMLGTVIVFYIFRNQLAEQAWAGFGSLSASWTGGSANMIAVKEALSTPESVFTPMVVVDTIVPYVWMGILLALAGRQAAFDKWNRADSAILDDLSGRIKKGKELGRSKKFRRPFLIIALVSITGMIASRFLSGIIPEIPQVLSRYGWMIIVVSCIGMGLFFTRLRSLGEQGASQTGYYLLYFVLTSIGAKASIVNLGAMPLLITMGFLIVLVHAWVLLVAARALRLPLFLLATASQANVGGVASAPVVSATYRPELASVGLLLAIFGNIMGTYLGIITGRVCCFIK